MLGGYAFQPRYHAAMGSWPAQLRDDVGIEEANPLRQRPSVPGA